jgi:ammonia channel protein AmtB
MNVGLNGGTVGQMVAGLFQAREIKRENDAGLIDKIIALNDAQVSDCLLKLPY